MRVSVRVEAEGVSVPTPWSPSMSTHDRTLARARSLSGMAIINLLIAVLGTTCLLAVLAGAVLR